MVLGRALGDTYSPVVRQNLTLVTVARLVTNSAFRYVIPFLGVLADGLDVRISSLGIALTVSTLTGLLGTPIGRLIDRGSHRKLMVLGLLGMAVGTTVAAVSPDIWWFGAGLVLIGIAKLVFDVSMTGWVAEYVPPDVRGRVFGLIEMSWAAGLFLGVTVLALITAVSSWRWAYATMTLVLVVVALVVLARLPGGRAASTAHQVMDGPPRGRVTLRGLQFLVAMGFLLFSIQVLISVLGPWLQDDHGFTSGSLAAVTFGLGVFELVSSFGAIRLTDRWGGWRSVMRGGSLMIPAALLFSLGNQNLWLGLVAFAVITLGFEYCIISSFSVGTSLIPDAPGAGLGLMFTFNTIGMAVGSLLGTWVYDNHGPGAATAPVVASAGIAFLLLFAGVNSQGRPAASAGRPART
jgi:predicted MFS family arabinose efflux permease